MAALTRVLAAGVVPALLAVCGTIVALIRTGGGGTPLSAPCDPGLFGVTLAPPLHCLAALAHAGDLVCSLESARVNGRRDKICSFLFYYFLGRN